MRYALIMDNMPNVSFISNLACEILPSRSQYLKSSEVATHLGAAEVYRGERGIF
jgi:hypothetical protein